MNAQPATLFLFDIYQDLLVYAYPNTSNMELYAHVTK